MLLDEQEIERRLLERRGVARAFRAQRKEVEDRREQDRLDRNAAKERQLQEAEELQVYPGIFLKNPICLRAPNVSFSSHLFLPLLFILYVPLSLSLSSNLVPRARVPPGQWSGM